MEEPALRPHERTLTHADYVQLSRFLLQGGKALAGADEVWRMLERSRRAAPSLVPPGLVTMNAKVFLLAGPEEEYCRLSLCYPGEVDPARGRISVLSPLGSSLLGRCAGETTTWRSFGRVHAARILGVLPPG